VRASGDTCGAGDQFAAAAAAALADGALVSEAVPAAVAAATRFVADGAARSFGAAPRSDAPAEPAATGGGIGLDGARDLAERVHARGGVVVATGGCFDLLHPGHVATLRAARSLGDCLVVCLNSDASVRKLKGPQRPLSPQHDRAAVLAALSFVDSVVVFNDTTPAGILQQLRPDVWVKGGDYFLDDEVLPESAVLRGWGGQTVVVPYLPGHSTSELIRLAQGDAVPGRPVPTRSQRSGR
ncbi:MAG TPA: adenylyltransferase/cytidyltransferase family protein, partial [Rugosimonospora sp.]|nr:adenylyltransferase/cytidyltransferase family protein [Rugosimonospora sp.]